MFKLDLRTDLAKVTDARLGDYGSCRYTAPCAIGAMLTPAQRCRFANKSDDDTQFGVLLDNGVFKVPEDQIDDFKELQRRFDRARGPEAIASFNEFLGKLKEKYA